MHRVGRTVILIWFLCAGVAEARELQMPAELPPPTFAGQQYVDSLGCLFMRAGTEAEVLWIPRVTRGGTVICGYPPSGRRVPIAGEPGATIDFEAPTQIAGGDNPVTKGGGTSSAVMVAVGSFSVIANADHAARSMADLGLPVIRGDVVRKGRALTSIFAGPFETVANARRALLAIKGAGFPDAMIVGQ